MVNWFVAVGFGIPSEVLTKAMRLRTKALPGTTGTIGNSWQASESLESRTSHCQAPLTTVPLVPHTPYQKGKGLKAHEQNSYSYVVFNSSSVVLHWEQVLQTKQLASSQDVPPDNAKSPGPWTLCEMPCSWPKHRSLHH